VLLVIIYYKILKRIKRMLAVIKQVFVQILDLYIDTLSAPLSMSRTHDGIIATIAMMSCTVDKDLITTALSPRDSSAEKLPCFSGKQEPGL